MFGRNGTSGTEWIDGLREAIGASVLGPHGFRRFGKGDWVRWNGWKADWVSIVNEFGGIATSVTYIVALPPGGPVEGRLDFNALVQTSPGELLHRSSEKIQVPRKRSRQAKLLDSMVQDVSATIQWFDTHAGTVDLCLGLLQASDLVSDAPAFEEMKRYLTCVREGSHELLLEGLRADCSDFTRRLFFADKQGAT